MSKVHLVSITRAASREEVAAKLGALWRAAGLAECFRPRDLAAVKVHVGEPGRPTYVPPRVVRELVSLIKQSEASPFVTDTAVLYRSPRDNGVGHTMVAADHGYDLEGVGCPFVPADGLNGADEIDVTVNGKHDETVAIASAIVHARSMLVVTHATGHLGTGFGGTLKNLGMGCSSKKGKLRQHSGQTPSIDAEACTSCGTCAEWCPADAIEVDDVAVIDAETCIGCGECVATCLDGAVRFDWSVMGRDLQERIVEHAAAVVRGKPDRIAYVTVAYDITQDCDCLGRDQPSIVPDIGILASRDPVALDRAVLDLVRERAGQTLESLSYPDRDGTVQIDYAAEMELGESHAEVVEVDVR